MTRAALEQVISTRADICEKDKTVVVGSRAILEKVPDAQTRRCVDRRTCRAVS